MNWVTFVLVTTLVSTALTAPAEPTDETVESTALQPPSESLPDPPEKESAAPPEIPSEKAVEQASTNPAESTAQTASNGPENTDSDTSVQPQVTPTEGTTSQKYSVETVPAGIAGTSAKHIAYTTSDGTEITKSPEVAATKGIEAGTAEGTKAHPYAPSGGANFQPSQETTVIGHKDLETIMGHLGYTISKTPKEATAQPSKESTRRISDESIPKASYQTSAKGAEEITLKGLEETYSTSTVTPSSEVLRETTASASEASIPSVLEQTTSKETLKVTSESRKESESESTTEQPKETEKAGGAPYPTPKPASADEPREDYEDPAKVQQMSPQQFLNMLPVAFSYVGVPKYGFMFDGPKHLSYPNLRGSEETTKGADSTVLGARKDIPLTDSKENSIPKTNSDERGNSATNEFRGVVPKVSLPEAFNPFINQKYPSRPNQAYEHNSPGLYGINNNYQNPHWQGPSSSVKHPMVYPIDPLDLMPRNPSDPQGWNGYRNPAANVLPLKFPGFNPLEPQEWNPYRNQPQNLKPREDSSPNPFGYLPINPYALFPLSPASSYAEQRKSSQFARPAQVAGRRVQASIPQMPYLPQPFQLPWNPSPYSRSFSQFPAFQVLRY